jgi:hypothetical protein
MNLLGDGLTVISSLVKDNVTLAIHHIASLQERIKGPTAASCADGKMSGPSAQQEARGGGEEGRRHR